MTEAELKNHCQVFVSECLAEWGASTQKEMAYRIFHQISPLLHPGLKPNESASIYSDILSANLHEEF